MTEFNTTQEIRLKVSTSNFTNGEGIKMSLEPLDENKTSLGKKNTYASVSNGLAQHVFTIEALANELHVDITKIVYVAGWIDKDNDGVVEGDEVVYLKVKALQWHDPVDNPQLCLYNNHGLLRPWSNTFGMVRINPDQTLKRHQGVDLFAMPETEVYACVDGIVKNVHYSGPTTTSPTNYGHQILIMAKDPASVRANKKQYTLPYQIQHHEQEKDTDFNDSPNGSIYFFYAHLIECYVTVV
jgi:murein DD-endopeptidase MepM/ murein hydrolase activator NlpD